MDIEERKAKITELMAKNKAALTKLQPALHPGSAIPFTKLGLLNAARHKEKKLVNNINFLTMAQGHPELMTDEILQEYLK